MSKKSHTSLLGVAAAVVVVVVLVILLVVAARRPREESRRDPCRNNLNQLGKCMVTYVAEFGDGRWLPFPLDRRRVPHDFNGAEWLVSVYWVGIMPDPGVYICPSSSDTNHEGRDLGTSRAAPGVFGSRAVSYAGLHYYSQTDTAGNPRPSALANDLAPNEPVASDDTQGAINHGSRDNGRMNVLFWDLHVQGETNTKIDLERAVGQTGGLLWRLRN